MNKLKQLTILFCLTLSFVAAQDQITTSTNETNISDVTSPKDILLGNFVFNTTTTGNNSKQHEFGSGFFRQKFIVISSKKIGARGGRKDPRTGEPNSQIYCSTIKKTGDLENHTLFSRILNTTDAEGGLSITSNQNTIYYTRDDISDQKRQYIMYRAFDKKKDGQWLDSEQLPFNKAGYSFEHPYVSRDGKTLYFSSNMPGGNGGFDLYRVEIAKDGTLGKPINLGSEVNTPYDETTPYIDDSNKYFYYASNGRNTLGGLDIFRTRKIKNNFVRPLNLGPTINTKKDDYAFYLANKKRGYVTSVDREGGIGGSDIYKFRLEYNRQLIKGNVVDGISGEKLPNIFLQIKDLDDNKIPFKMNDDGTFSAYIDPYESYKILVKKEGYEDNLSTIETNSATERIFDLTVRMELKAPEIVTVETTNVNTGEIKTKKIIQIEKIYFDYNKATIRKVSEVSLNRIIKVLNDNPEMKIEINAHTDIRGTEQYNLSLSNRRAASSMRYLIDHGIDPNRLISKGYGESEPVYDCMNKTCTEAEHEKNRRTEFVIIE